MDFHELMNSSFKAIANKFPTSNNGNQLASTSDDSMNYSHPSSPNVYTVKTVKLCNEHQIFKIFSRQPYSLIVLLLALDKSPELFRASMRELTENDIDDLVTLLPVKAFKIH